MKRRHLIRIFRAVALLALTGLLGCSSLPKNQEPETATGSQAALHHAAGSTHFQAGRFDKACTFYQRALYHYATVDDQPGVVQTLTALGRCRLAMGQLDQADENFQAALTAVRRLPHIHLKAQVMAGLGEADLHRQDPEAARAWFEKGLALPIDQDSRERAVLLHDLGAAWQALGDATAAEDHFQQALAVNGKLHNPLGIATNCYALAQLQSEKGNIAEATKLAQRALNNDKKAENPPGIAQDLELLGNLAQGAGDPESAADYRRRAALIRRSLDRPGWNAATVTGP